MQKTFILRVLFIGALIFLFVIALTMIRGVVVERQSLQQQVENTVAESFAGDQTIVGPILVVPIVERSTSQFVNDKGKTITNVSEKKHELVYLPRSVRIDGDSNVEMRYKGIYKAMTYRWNAALDAEFEVPANAGRSAKPADITVGNAYLAFGVADVRGLVQSPNVTWNGDVVRVENGARTNLIGDGVHVPLGAIDISKATTHKTKFTVALNGMRSLGFSPVARNTVVELKSSWPHPNFGGRFLPASKTITESGFNAKWEVAQLATNNASTLFATPSSSQGGRAQLESFRVHFIEPVNVYQQVERATKYGLLFIGLTFAAVFLFESLKQLRIHPIQYAFVGFALSLFFLLLLSLSEHIAFALAYAIASSACVLLIAYYLAFVLQSRARGAVFGVQLAVLYAVLYGLLLSEDNALIMGSILLFVLLAAVMIVTRKVDWYQLWTSPTTAKSAKTPPKVTPANEGAA
jgi:inner membrane protein